MRIILLIIIALCAPAIADEPQGHYVVAFCADWCSPCRVWNDSNNPHKIESAGIAITHIDIQAEPRWLTAGKILPAVERLPTFWLVDRETRLPVKTWTGSLTLEQIREALKDGTLTRRPVMQQRGGRWHGMGER